MVKELSMRACCSISHALDNGDAAGHGTNCLMTLLGLETEKTSALLWQCCLLCGPTAGLWFPSRYRSFCTELLSLHPCWSCVFSLSYLACSSAYPSQRTFSPGFALSLLHLQFPRRLVTLGQRCSPHPRPGSHPFLHNLLSLDSEATSHMG